MDPSLPQNLWVLFYTFQKSVGSMEPTEPTLTTPLAHVLLRKMAFRGFWVVTLFIYQFFTYLLTLHIYECY